MAANALTTAWSEPELDIAALLTDYTMAYDELSSAYHQVARVWYRQNLQVDSWHWHARQQRLRAGGLSLYERDKDAFTALCLGAVGSPLDAAVRVGSKDIWRTEFFVWLTAHYLFPSQDLTRGAWSQVTDSESARHAARWEVMHRWQRLMGSRVTLIDGCSWEVGKRYHTNRFMDRWQRVRFLGLNIPPQREEGVTRVILPAFEDMPEGILPMLDGSRVVADAMRELLLRHPVGSDERDDRAQAMAECVLQLDMLDRVQVQPVRSPDTLQGHPVVTRLLCAFVRALKEPATLGLELEWLGDSAALRVDVAGAERRWFRLMDARDAASNRTDLETRATVLRFNGHLDQDDWARVYARRAMAFLHRYEQREPELRTLWDRARGLGGVAVELEHTPGEPSKLVVL